SDGCLWNRFLLQPLVQRVLLSAALVLGFWIRLQSLCRLVDRFWLWLWLVPRRLGNGLPRRLGRLARRLVGSCGLSSGIRLEQIPDDGILWPGIRPQPECLCQQLSYK